MLSVLTIPLSPCGMFGTEETVAGGAATVLSYGNDDPGAEGALSA